MQVRAVPQREVAVDRLGALPLNLDCRQGEGRGAASGAARGPASRRASTAGRGAGTRGAAEVGHSCCRCCPHRCRRRACLPGPLPARRARPAHPAVAADERYGGAERRRAGAAEPLPTATPPSERVSGRAPTCCFSAPSTSMGAPPSSAERPAAVAPPLVPLSSSSCLEAEAAPLLASAQWGRRAGGSARHRMQGSCTHAERASRYPSPPPPPPPPARAARAPVSLLTRTNWPRTRGRCSASACDTGGGGGHAQAQACAGQRPGCAGRGSVGGEEAGANTPCASGSGSWCSRSGFGASACTWRWPAAQREGAVRKRGPTLARRRCAQPTEQ